MKAKAGEEENVYRENVNNENNENEVASKEIWRNRRK
jgi:hypothetical protein